MKGQLILKGLLGILEFFQKNELTNLFLVLLGKKPEIVRSFFEESLAWKKHDFVWPLHLTCIF